MKHTTLKNIPGGYTLIEMLVVIAIIVIIMPVVFISIERLYDTHAITLSKALVLTDTTRSVKEIARDVRSAVYAENGALPIASMGTSTLTIYTDTDYDGEVERVRYYLSNGIMYKGIIEPTATHTYPNASETVTELIKGVKNETLGTPVFQYYTSTSTEITSNSNVLLVRRISAELITGSTVHGEQSEVGFRTSASIRNLKETY